MFYRVRPGSLKLLEALGLNFRSTLRTPESS